MDQSDANLNNIDSVPSMQDTDMDESQWSDYNTTDISQPAKKPCRTPNKDNRVSFKCNRKLHLHSTDSISNTTSVQMQLAHLISKLEIMDERLVKTVTTNDLDKKLNNMVTHEEFMSFAESIVQRADKEKELHSKIEHLQIANTVLQDKLTQLESKVDTAVQKADLAIYKSDVAHDKCDDLEQHGRSNTIRLYGAEDRDENETELLRLC